MATLLFGNATSTAIGSTASDRNLRISGQFEQFWESASSKSAASNSLSTSFVCVLDGNGWWIDLQWPSGTSQRWQFDGTNLYQKIIARTSETTLIGGDLPPKSSGRIFTNNSVNSSKEVSSVHVFSGLGGCPFDDYYINIPWLAFCSGDYLKNPDRVIPLPTVDAHHSPDSLAYKDNTETYADALGLPKSVRLLADEKLFQESVLHGVFKGKRDVELWRKGSNGFKWDMRDGSLRFLYQVVSVTNLPQGKLPTEFVWTTYRADGSESQTEVRGRGSVFQITSAVAPNPMFTPGDGTTVVDWRINDAQSRIRGVVYRTTNMSAPLTNNPVVLAAIERRKWQLSSDPKPPMRWTGLVFVIASMSALAFLLWKTKTSKQQV